MKGTGSPKWIQSSLVHFGQEMMSIDLDGTFRPGAMGLHAYLLRSFSRVAASLWDAQTAFLDR